MNLIFFPESKYYRKKAGFTLAELAKAAGIDQKQIILAESSEAITEEVFKKMAAVLNKALEKKKEPLIDVDLILNGTKYRSR